MINKIHILIFPLLLSFTAAALADSTKTISLKDGSVIKGKILELTDGKYKVETTNVGTLEIKDEDIVTITSGDVPPPAASTNNPAAPTQPLSGFQSQMQQFQGQLMANPSAMSGIMGLANDPSITAILSDPSISKDIMSYDPEKIQNNPKIQELMQNPKMQELIKSLSSQMVLPEQPKN